MKALGWPKDYQYINIGKLPAKGARTGYPTPTLLWKGKDIFGMAVPKSPFDTRISRLQCQTGLPT